MKKIDWESTESEVLINPRMPSKQQQFAKMLTTHFSTLKGHLWLATSGSTQLKWVALSKNAVLASAKAVNTHLDISSKDIWMNPLPLFHVGGLGILARAYLSQSQVISAEEKWNARTFHGLVQDSGASLTSLVPTQVHDLMMNGLESPKSLRGVIVGGGRLSEELYQQALALGWPLLPSYGMTECASQVATASLNSQALKVLSHLNVRVNEENRICVKGGALLTGYAISTQQGPAFIDPKVNGWFLTEDVGQITESGELEVSGRLRDFIKIGGESVHLGRLESILDNVKRTVGITIDCALMAVPDSRLGYVIHFVSVGSSPDVQKLLDGYHAQVLPFEQVRKVHAVKEIPRSLLGKLLLSALELSS
jgi:O-succinylbenzoic acid--CoA ligase